MHKRIILTISLILCAGFSFGAALTAERDTPSRSGEKMQLTVADTITIYAGAMVAVDSNGEAQNAADTANYQVVGRCDKTVNNTDDGEVVNVERGVFGWANAGDVTDANIGSIAYVIDNQTVSVATNGSNSIIAGTVVDVDGSYVWVDTFNISRTAGAFTTLSASGASSFAAVDADSYTVDAGAGLDNQAAGTLVLGAATATKVEIADADVETEIEGTLSCEQDVELAYANKTANYTITANDCVLSYNTSAATTNTLPEASTVLGKVFFVSLQDDDGDLEVWTDGTDTFDGTNNKITFADAGDSLSVMATAANVYTILVNVGGTLGTQ